MSGNTNLAIMPVLPILCVCEKAELLNAVRYVHEVQVNSVKWWTKFLL